MTAPPSTVKGETPPLEALNPAERTKLLRRTLAVLAMGVVPAGAALSGSFATTALLAEEITGSGTLAGLASASVTGGTAVASIPIAQLMAKRGRRVGMVTAYVLGAIGGALAFAAASFDVYVMLIIGAAMVGAANSGTLAARFAAADLAEDDTRARAIGILVWLGMFGSVAGPSLALRYATDFAENRDLARLGGPYLLVTVLFAVAGTIVFFLLRPDPLEMAGGVERNPARSGFGELGQTFASLLGNRLALTAIGCLAASHAVMVGVMSMTSLHMDHGGHSLEIIGLVISLHIVGMYFFAPVIGWLTDRVDSSVILAAGGAVLVLGCELAARNTGLQRVDIFSGLFFVGLGWSFALVASSAIVTASVPSAERVKMQGLSDFAMTTAGVLAAISAGSIVEFFGYATLAHLAAGVSIGVIIAGVTASRRQPSSGSLAVENA